MLLLKKGEKAREICRECRKLHGGKECPKREARRLEVRGMTAADQRRAEERFKRA